MFLKSYNTLSNITLQLYTNSDLQTRIDDIVPFIYETTTEY